VTNLHYKLLQDKGAIKQIEEWAIKKFCPSIYIVHFSLLSFSGVRKWAGKCSFSGPGVHNYDHLQLLGRRQVINAFSFGSGLTLRVGRCCFGCAFCMAFTSSLLRF
jgi:hypothetical protein